LLGNAAFITAPAKRSTKPSSTALWLLPEPPDAGLVSVVRQAAEAWGKTASYLESILDATPEKLAEARESYAERNRLLAEKEQRKEAREVERAEG
jgi:hypothetical protein